MKYSVEMAPKAEKLLNKLDNLIRIRIINWINTNLVDCENPRLHGKALNGNLSDKWSIVLGVTELLPILKTIKF